jgi:Acyltransferase family
MSTANVASVTPPPSQAPASNYNYAVGYLKAAIVALVVAHHAVLAYHPSAPTPPISLLTQPRTWQAFPIVDSHRAVWAAVFATFNDIFFMALMFFLSGLFVWNSLSRKGASRYLHDRLLRLGLPFIPAAIILAPLSYFPTYLQMPRHAGFAEYLRQWMALGSWSAGPVWFCWVLLVFDLIATQLGKVAPRWSERLSRWTGSISDRPTVFIGRMIAISAAVYFPLALVAGPFNWTAWGPFTFQTSRILLYFVYFLAGIGVGAWGLERGLLARHGQLAEHWRVWVRWSVLAFAAFALALQAAVSHSIPQNWEAGIRSVPWMAALLLFPVSCAASSFACLALSVRFFDSRWQALEGLTRSAYGIFLIHFVFVSWLGYALLAAILPALVKFLLVFGGALALSWWATLWIRRIPGAERVL